MSFRPSAKWPVLRLRAELLARLREFFGERGFLEVETPILSADVVVDRHLDPFCTTLATDPRQPEAGRRMWLQTSPEFHMKRLLAVWPAGDEPAALFQVAHAFRNAERGPLHNPEFTLIEWYRAGDGLAEGMQLLSDLCRALLERGAARRVSYAEAFEQHAGVNPHTASLAELRAAAERCGIAAPASTGEDRDAWLDVLLVGAVEPKLGVAQPEIMFDYPASQAALARVRPGDPPLAERFELYVGGLELANGYHELLDPDELRRRAVEANVQRAADGKPALPETSRLLEAMQAGLPPCCGVALGFDRLVMVAAGAESIEEVMPFPIERA